MVLQHKLLSDWGLQNGDQPPDGPLRLGEGSLRVLTTNSLTTNSMRVTVALALVRFEIFYYLIPVN